jgi:hypothetical protein
VTQVRDLRELDFEIPLSVTESDFPIGLLQHVQILHVLKFDSVGYRFVCRMSSEEWDQYGKTSGKRGPSLDKKINLRVLGTEESGSILLQVSGFWLEKGRKLDSDQVLEFDFFRSMEKAPAFALENPIITEHSIAFRVAADAEVIKKMLTGLKRLKIPHKVKKLRRFNAETRSMLDELSVQQGRVLKLAHTLGYYDIPRRTGTEDLARILGMNKATVGEHLRRAEKHIFDNLITD